MQKLDNFQRRLLLAMTETYKTVSTDCLQVLAGVLPFDLELHMIVGLQISCARRIGDENVPWLRLEESLDIWQDKWTSSVKGKWTRILIPNVKKRYGLPMILDHFVTQILTEQETCGESCTS